MLSQRVFCRKKIVHQGTMDIHRERIVLHLKTVNHNKKSKRVEVSTNDSVETMQVDTVQERKKQRAKLERIRSRNIFEALKKLNTILPITKKKSRYGKFKRTELNYPNTSL